MALTNPAIQQLQGAVVDQAGVFKSIAYDYFQRLSGLLASIIPILNASLGVNRFTLAGQPTLGSADAGYVGFVTDYAHLVYFDGANWQWLDGDRPYRFSDYGQAPGVGWGLCDGSTYAMLQVGSPTLMTANFTTPNLAGSPAYRKSAAAYTGTINAASGSTGTGTTGTGTTGTGTTGTGTTGGASITSGVDGDVGGQPTTGAQTTPGVYALFGHSHPVTVPGLSIPGLSVPGLSVPGLSVPALGVGSIDMANLGTLPYVRR